MPFHTIDVDGELIAFYNNIQNDESYLMIEKMVGSGEKRVIKTEENIKLSEWEKFVWPKLAEEQKKKEYKIEEFENWVIYNIESKGGSMTFQSLVSNIQQHEVSRAFLAVLDLANKEKIILPDEAYQGTDFNLIIPHQH
ncbi:hypothetical protein TRFO_29716 [Tritrichomonas foetus]|uniref:Condensin-2 complex subunit H2 C-terminal domain-containing protein n=1 Tax=Tritrichomonas foetus TaxID=1144522 RepID=A0A1J4JV39_9EUKA|nr:hypothetical protein TRFO_29716 [Tritrichomonas foetus]|eukprot:OHT03009.1 hypothetical protein TRFO_29716 [Tritrichomonas foetus]